MVAQEGPDTNPQWAPDGLQLAFQTAMGKASYFYQNRVIATIAFGSTTVRSMTDAFDENPNLIRWTDRGIQFSSNRLSVKRYDEVRSIRSRAST